ncbi:MAG: hypothetical protein ACRBBU_08985 [Pseudooceanicola sp.]
MTLFRVIFLIGAIATVAGAGYLSYYGVWRDSSDVRKSVRTGTHGPSGINGRVK